jgi:L-asparagine transporter-like permease
MTYWFPGSPVWIWSLGFAIALIYVNSRSVTNFGTFEYWFALIKVVAIIIFIILGITHIFGLVGEPVGFHNLTELEGGFMPHGFGGVWMAVIMAIFSFYGIEVIAVTSGEAKDPVTTIPAALRTMALRLSLFYVLALSVMVTFIPWTEIGAHVVTESPFVRLFSKVGIMYAAGIMNFVVLTAALSSMNTNIYLTSRMLFSLSRGSYAPQILGKLGANGTPVSATILSGVCILLAASISRLTPYAYNYLLGIALFGGLSVWIIILLSHLSFRRRNKNLHLPVRMPLFPYLQILGIILLAAILITMGLDTDFWNISWIVGIPWMIAISIAYAIWKRLQKARSTTAEYLGSE